MTASSLVEADLRRRVCAGGPSETYLLLTWIRELKAIDRPSRLDLERLAALERRLEAVRARLAAR